MALTRRQKEVLDFIAAFVDENGYSPSYDEIAHALNLASLATVHKHIIDDHICDGDMVLIERNQDFRDGDIVVALVKGVETSLKRIYREPRNMVRLQPANSEMKPMYYQASEVEIQGRLLAVLRKFR